MNTFFDPHNFLERNTSWLPQREDRNVSRQIMDIHGLFPIDIDVTVVLFL